MGQRILASNVPDDRQVAERQALPLSWGWRDRSGLVLTLVVLLGASTVFVVLASMYVPEAVRVAGMLVGTGGLTGQIEITGCTLQKGAESNEYWRCVGTFISDSGQPDADGVAGRSYRYSPRRGSTPAWDAGSRTGHRPARLGGLSASWEAYPPAGMERWLALWAAVATSAFATMLALAIWGLLGRVWLVGMAVFWVLLLATLGEATLHSWMP